MFCKELARGFVASGAETSAFLASGDCHALKTAVATPPVAGRPITHVLKQFNHRALPNIAMGAQFDRTPGWALRILESLNHFGRFDELSL